MIGITIPDKFITQTSKIDILLGEIRSSGEEKITHMCVCVCVGGGATYKM